MQRKVNVVEDLEEEKVEKIVFLSTMWYTIINYYYYSICNTEQRHNRIVMVLDLKK